MITVNGKTYKGNNISISNGVVVIDGKRYDDKDAKNINISVVGNLESLDVDSCEMIMITGDVGTVETVNGNVKCGNVNGNVKTTNGNIKAGDIHGKATTSNGNIKRN